MMDYWKRYGLSFDRPSLFLIPLVLLASVVLVTWGALEDNMAMVIQLLAGFYGSVILWRWMTGAVWRPAIILLIQIPFQGVLGLYLGGMANLITWIPIAAFLLQIPKSEHIRCLFGSQTQRLIGVFVFGLSFSAVIAAPNSDLPDLLRGFGQKLTLIFIVAVLARALQEPGFDRKALLTISVSMAIMVSIALMEHYLGVSVLRSAPKEFEHLGDYRLSGPGNSLPINRMAFFHILPISLIVSSLFSREVRVSLLAVLALSILGLGLVSTGSRGGIMGTLFALGLVWLHSRAKVTSAVVIVVVTLVGAVIVTTIVPPEAFTRSGGTGVLTNVSDRARSWGNAFGYFLRNPIFGVGWGQLESAVLRDYPLSRDFAPTAHNSVLNLLSESGLMGTIPFLILCWYVVKVLWRGAHLDEESSGPLHLGAFVAFSGMLLATMTSVYQFERYFWVPVAFAASLELRGMFQPAYDTQGDRLLPRRTVSGSYRDGKRASISASDRVPAIEDKTTASGKVYE
jgi:O-antigen ligase